jgi:hypothetical protein
MVRPFFESITENENRCDHFLQNDAAARTSSYSINVLNEVKWIAFWDVAPCTNPKDFIHAAVRTSNATV